MSRIQNCFNMIYYLSGRSYKLKELAELLNTSISNVRYIRKDLENVGFKFQSKAGVGGYIKLEKSPITPLNFSSDEVGVIYSALTHALSDGSVADETTIQKTLGKLILSFDYLDKSNSEINILTHAKNAMTPLEQLHLSKLQQAIQSEWVCHITYIDNQFNETSRNIYPYKIISYQHFLYLACYCEKREQHRIFKLTRIKTLHIMYETYDSTKLSGIDDFINNRDGIFKGKPANIELIVKPPFSAMLTELKKFDIQSHTFINHTDIRFSATTELTPEIVNWVLSMGDSVLVVKPQALKEQLLEKVEKINKIYKSVK